MRLIFIVAAMTAVLATAPAWSQYKYLDANGRVTYSDMPPPPGARPAAAAPVGARSAGPAAPNANLPFELRSAMERFPVVLYTTDKCDACNSARSYLRSRGVPHSERLVRSNDEISVFKQLSSAGTIPLMQVGSNKLIGFDQGDWGAMLDQAGYPATSVLPANFQFAAASSALPPAAPVAPAAPADGPVAAGTAAESNSGTNVPPAVNAPPGFRF